jgi:hypothetical protein
MIEAAANVPADILSLLNDIIAADGYGAAIHAWPDGPGHAKLEVVAHEGFCPRRMSDHAEHGEEALAAQSIHSGVQGEDR